MKSPEPQPSRSLGQALLLGFGLSWLVAFILLLLTALGVLLYGYSWVKPRLTAFTETAQTSLSEAIVTGYVGWTGPVAQAENRTNFLILGVDSLETRGDAPALTDTMMLVSLNHLTGEIKTVSIPRDTWSETYTTRINALYFYGQDRYPNKPETFPTQVIQDLTDIPIHYTVVISLDQLGELIELVGGVTVTVPEGFIDPQFPRTDVDVTIERDPAKLYQTIEFKAGEQLMNGQRALEYVRSRKSLGETGTDTARTARQQQLIAALLAKLTNSETLSNPTLLGHLYFYYQQTFNQYLPLTKAIALGKILLPVKDSLTFSGQNLGIFPEDPQGSLFHPDPRRYTGQWLYIIQNPDTFRSEVRQKLNVP